MKIDKVEEKNNLYDELLKNLIDGFNTNSKSANQILLFFITLQFFCIINFQTKNKEVELIFSLGKVSFASFTLISIVSISIMSLIFSSLMIKIIKTKIEIYKLAENIKNFEKNDFTYLKYLDSVTNFLYTDFSSIFTNYFIKKKNYNNWGFNIY